MFTKDEELDNAKIFVSMLSNESIQKYKNLICKSLVNIKDGVQYYKQLYCTDESFSTNQTYTIKTLAYLARMDNPEKYKEWNNEHMELICKKHDIIDSSKSSSSVQSFTYLKLSIIMYHITWLDYCCYKNNFYYYNNHHWSQDQHILFSEIKTKLSEFGYYNQNINIVNILNNLKDFLYSDNEMDQHNYIISCSNCVIDSSNNKAVSRIGVPEDYISYNRQIDYKEFTNEDLLVIEFDNYLNQMFGDQLTKECILIDIASFLNKENKKKYNRIWTGEGSSGKSMFTKIAYTAVGEERGKNKEEVYYIKESSTQPKENDKNIIPFLSRFTQRNNEVDEPHRVYRGNVNLDKKINKYAEVLLWLIVNKYFDIYIKEGVIDCNKLNKKRQIPDSFPVYEDDN